MSSSAPSDPAAGAPDPSDGASAKITLTRERFDHMIAAKNRLDEARDLLERCYEAFSAASLDNLASVKADLDKAREEEQACYNDLQIAYNSMMRDAHHPRRRRGEEFLQSVYMPQLVSSERGVFYRRWLVRLRQSRRQPRHNS